MEATTYRRRLSGRGSRVAGKRRASALSPRERRRLRQLLASVVIFLLVFLGRGVLPGGAQAWQAVLNRDMDLTGVLRALSGQEGWESPVLDRLKEAFPALKEESDREADKTEPPQNQTPIPKLPTYLDRLPRPGIAGGETAEGPSAEAEAPAEDEGTEVSGEEPVVTAVAQRYTEDGKALPERVSLSYYNLGLKETAVPAMGAVTSDFGYRNHPVSGEYSFHSAVDVAMDVGTEILAFADGTVRYIGENGVFGLYVKLDHGNGVSTFYAHCDELLVDKGERIVCGQVIALSGETGNATGPHLHFSLEKDGIRLDPQYYLEF